MSQEPFGSIESAELTDGVVRLRPLRVTDAPQLVKSVDARMIAFTHIPVNDPGDYTITYAVKHIEGLIRAEGTVAWALTEPDNTGDRYCGSIEFRQNPSGRNPFEGELGYNTAPWARNRGLQGRGVRLATKHLFQQGIHRVVIKARVDNMASRWVAERADFAFEGFARDAEHLRDEFYDLAVYSALPTDPAYRT
ncbi:GNAT family N-acetyltransferase [Corynebacterium sp. HMSC28B08]|uniref:GNAT family N-acetyltransferase n=1 Tax=Corynebacterium TaxID=1716 RepID=UPI0008A4898D|nr:GNAT family protein [Corynebacterium sp. HMSC28B08]OFT87006.1 hypothetical protein HMPREF3098_10210 [Corynebacterium sp. HMSC28B08]